jgi:hypothetical protein
MKSCTINIQKSPKFQLSFVISTIETTGILKKFKKLLNHITLIL